MGLKWLIHLRQTASCGVNTTAHQATSQFEQTIRVQRGISYIN